MSIRCVKCHRPMKHESPSGMGPVCTLAAYGRKQRPVKREPRTADESTPDLFAQELAGALRFHDLVAGVSLEMPG